MLDGHLRMVAMATAVALKNRANGSVGRSVGTRVCQKDPYLYISSSSEKFPGRKILRYDLLGVMIGFLGGETELRK